MFDPTHLHRPVADWPRLIAGPILRRVTAHSVAVFVAASEPVEVILTVYDGVGSSRAAIGDPARRATLFLGDRLHVCVVEATGLSLVPGRIYGYDIQLNNGVDVEDLGRLLNAEIPLGYVAGHLPGFVLPGPLDSLRVVHASCRKPHGCHHDKLMDPDVFPLVDRLLQDSHTDPLRRPQQLFLTGDQIYSDDVPAALLAALSATGPLLLGWDEGLPAKDGGTIPRTSEDLLPGNRAVLLDGQGVKDRPPGAKGWDEYAANHLLYFGEWCAMYLFAWSPELWQRTDTVLPDLRRNVPDAFYYYLPSATDVWAKSPDTTFPTQIYAQGLEFVRRALANVPTYMVFDDHDVTDDWFLNAKVDQQLRGQGDTKGPLGRRLMRNALAAYALFQHWGNAPEAFYQRSPGGALLELLNASSGSPPIASDAAAADVILDVGPAAVGPDRQHERMRWDYEVVFDQHRVIVLDTRTWRGYPTGPRPLTETEVRDAGASGAGDLPFEWGPTSIEAVATLWQDAAAELTSPMAGFLAFGADCLRACADLARVGELRAGDPAAPADEVRAALRATLDTLALAPGAQSRSWAPAALDAASAAVGAARYDASNDVVLTVERVATALHETAFILRDAVREASIAVAPEDMYDQFEFLTAMGTAANLAASAADFLEGAVHAVQRAARSALAFFDAWSLLAVDAAETLWEADATAGANTLWQVADDSAPIRADLTAAVDEIATTPDPVWNLVQDPDRRRNSELIGAEALVFQVHERVWTTDDRRELTLVVSGAPVFGHALAEFGQRAAISISSMPEPEEYWDNEPWSGNSPAMHRFLDALAPLDSVVFLSGDVHYAFSSVTDYLADDGTAARFVQLTASAAKNAEAKTRLLQFLDDEIDVRLDQLLSLDWLSVLPAQDEWDQVPPDTRALLSSREEALATVARHRLHAELAAADQDGVRGWVSGLLNRPSLREDLARSEAEPFAKVQQDTARRSADELEAVGRFAGDPSTAFVGDRAHGSQQVVLAAAGDLQADSRGLPNERTTVLLDQRLFERETDSPGLASRIATFSFLERMRMLTLLTGRRTVGRNNIGVITSQTHPLGRFLTHDIHWFPFDPFTSTIQPDTLGAKFRDDWIITRHVAGLTRGMPHDGSRLAPAPSPPVHSDDVYFHLEVTSPGHVQVGSRRVHGITAAAPTMPDLTITAMLVGLDPAQEATQTRELRLECRYTEGNRTDIVHLPELHQEDPDKVVWKPVAPGVTIWRPVLPAEFFGGELTVFARADVAGRPEPVTAQSADAGHAVWGRNPSKDDVRAHAALVADGRLGTNMNVVFHRESKFTQFARSATQLGSHIPGPETVLRSPRYSFGVGQLDKPDPRVDDVNKPYPRIDQLWHWRHNVDASVARLVAGRADAMTYQEQVRLGSAWTFATGTFDRADPHDPPPPDEGFAQPDATPFTTDELDLEMWSRYNGGRRFHDWDGQAWVPQPSTNSSVTTYAPALLQLRRAVDAGNLPGGW